MGMKMETQFSKIAERKLTQALGRVRDASRVTALLTNAQKNLILREAASGIRKYEKELLAANRKDLDYARSQKLSSAMMDRLTLSAERIQQIAASVDAVASLQDPIGKILSRTVRPNGLEVKRVTVPIGVILIIYEARPNVTAECASLCIKSGNAAVLRGGREAFHTNQAMASIFKRALKKQRVPEHAVYVLETAHREAVDFLLTREKDIQLVIPRGGHSLIEKVVAQSRIPVIKHYQGICHVYIDDNADVRKAAAIVHNAKLQRPGVCNAMETLLVSRKAAARFLPELEKLIKGRCEVRADEASRRFWPWAKKARPEDFGHEYLDKIFSMKIVRDVRDAVDHISRYGSGHTESIVTRNKKNADFFVQNVDASSVMVNASTRFADGFEYGLGAEIGISTDKIHARGPMGLEGLTSYKYVVTGSGQIRK